MKPEKFEYAETEMLCNGIPNCNDLFIGTAIDQQSQEVYQIAKFNLEPDEIERVVDRGAIWICNRGVWVPVLPTVHHPYHELGFMPVRPKEN